MRLLTVPMDARPAEIRGPDADVARRAAFVASARAVARSGVPARRAPARRRHRGRGRGPGRARPRLAVVRFAARDRQVRCLVRPDPGQWLPRPDCAAGTSSASSRWTPGIDPAGRDPFQTFLERDALLAGLTRLTPDERIVVVLRYWADLPLEAIADRLDWPLGTVKSRLHRALDRLRGVLAADPQEAGR